MLWTSVDLPPKKKVPNLFWIDLRHKRNVDLYLVLLTLTVVAMSVMSCSDSALSEVSTQQQAGLNASQASSMTQRAATTAMPPSLRAAFVATVQNEANASYRAKLERDDTDAIDPVEVDSLVAVQEAKLLAQDAMEADEMGLSVALSGDTAIVGAINDDIGVNSNQGSAYIFTRSGGVWTQQAKLTVSDGAANDNFGMSVALSGDTALVGAPSNRVGANAQQGSVYFFTRNGGVWTQQAKLVAQDGAAQDLFGSSLALSGDTALVGATFKKVGANGGQGSAYVFTRSGVAWTQQAKLVAQDGAANDFFGSSVALSGDTALVGAYRDTVGAISKQGSAYVFTRSGVAWTQQAKLVAQDGAANDDFGISVALSGDTALVGAHFHNVGVNGDQGSAYVFTRSGVAWTQQAMLVAQDGAADDRFGISVALSGDTALVGSHLDDIGVNEDQGSVYAFTRSGVVWTQQAKFVAQDGTYHDIFGSSVTLSGDTALVGAYLDSDGVLIRGSAYAFRLRSSNGTACSTGTECASGFCTDGVCCITSCGGDCQACSVAMGAAVDGTCAPLLAGTLCRASAGVCDIVESCDGTSDACPVDAKAAMGTECRPSAGPCDIAEACDGLTDSCANDAKASATTVCRASAGVCDVDELCDGVGDACPPDTKVNAGVECRASTKECDAAEACDGFTVDCPADGQLPNGVPCADGTCNAGVCMGAGGSGGAGGGGGGGDQVVPPNNIGEDGSCGCRLIGAPLETDSRKIALAGLVLAALTFGRRRTSRSALCGSISSPTQGTTAM